MKTLRRTDVVIVGGGWTGLMMAKELGARTGLNIIVLERGKPRTTGGYHDSMDELDYVIRLRLMQDVSKDTFTFRHTTADRALPLRQHGSVLPGSGTGGAGEHWGGNARRLGPYAFQLRSHLVERYGAAKLPADNLLQDWGCSYAEMEPWYTRAEQLIGVSGQSGLHPFEPPRSAPYPVPPLKVGPFPKSFADAARSQGYHPYFTSSAILSQPYTNPDGVSRPACQYCGYCDRFGCMVKAKAQPTAVLMPAIARSKNVTITHGASVRRVLHQDGHATGVTWFDNGGQEYFQPAGLVILSSWTLSNNRLLLLSKIGEPYDPGTGKGQVGRNLTHQASGGVIAFVDKPLNGFMGAASTGVAISDLECDNFDHGPLNFLGGAYVQASTPGHPPIGAFGVLPPHIQATWGSEWKKAALEWYDRSTRIIVMGDHFAYKTNYLSLDPTYRDSLGDPLVRVTMDWTDNERNLRAYVIPKIVELARAIPGVQHVRPPAPYRRYDATVYLSSHLQGGVIQGGSPDTSMLNPWLQCWNMTNLFVLGGSSFPQNCFLPTQPLPCLPKRYGAPMH